MGPVGERRDGGRGQGSGVRGQALGPVGGKEKGSAWIRPWGWQGGYRGKRLARIRNVTWCVVVVGRG